MKVIELMEKAGINQTGRAIMYIKEALAEIAVISPTHTTTTRIDIVKDQRFYEVPNDALRMLDLRCKDHDNDDGLYQSIPRSIYEPQTQDADGK
tara:strand:- start:2042 stop:2323 length:282 start_codon:yes stop_codon:yes gene_type:complete